MFSVQIEHVCPSPFTFGCANSVGFLSGSIECVHCIRLVIGMVVTIHPFEDLNCNSEKTTDFVRWHSKLCLPRDRGMTQCMRRDFRT
jgi:hypothetical protein